MVFCKVIYRCNESDQFIVDIVEVSTLGCAMDSPSAGRLLAIDLIVTDVMHMLDSGRIPRTD